METVIRIAQGLLAAVLVMAGSMKLAQPKERLAASGQAWVEDFDAQQVKGIGVLEVLAAIGLVLPAALDLVPILTAIAASGAVLLMIGRRHDPPAARRAADAAGERAHWRSGVVHRDRAFRPALALGGAGTVVSLSLLGGEQDARPVRPRIPCPGHAPIASPHGTSSAPLARRILGRGSAL
jgi:DoxX-like family